MSENHNQRYLGWVSDPVRPSKPPPPLPPKRESKGPETLLGFPTPGPPPAPLPPKRDSKAPETLLAFPPPAALPPPATIPSEPPGPIKAPLGPPRGMWRVHLADAFAACVSFLQRVVLPWTVARLSDIGRLAESWVARAREATKYKPRWFLPVVSGGTAVVLLILVLAAGKLACSALSPPPPVSSARVPAERKMLEAREVSAQPMATMPRITCALTGTARSIAPKALAVSGVEVAALGSEIAVGFAATTKDAMLELLDPATGAIGSSARMRAHDPIRRVVGLSRTNVALDVDRAGDPLHGRRVLVTTPPIDVGGTDDGFGWAPHTGNKPIKLWALPQPNVAVEQVRGEALADGKGFAVAFRQGSVVYAGVFGGAPPAPLAPLVSVDGLGAKGGSPAIAASGDRVMFAWSDRASPEKPWSVRTAAFRVGDAAAQVRTFQPPSGGLGEQTMSPDLTSLGEGRFLFVWTEGLATHQVRGALVGEDGSAISPFVVSADGVDAGQGQSATLPSGQGVVAFLAATKAGYEAMAAPLACTR